LLKFLGNQKKIVSLPWFLFGVRNLVFLFFLYLPCTASAQGPQETRDPLYHLGYSHYLSGRYRESLQAFQRFYQIAPRSSLSVPEISLSKNISENKEDAQTGMVKPVLRNPHFRRGLSLLSQENFESALQEFQVASGQLPSGPSLAFYRGYSLYKLKKFRQARIAFQETYQEKPDFTPRVQGR